MNNRKILVVLIIGIFIVSSIGGFLGAGEITSNNSNGNTDTTIEIKSFNLNVGEPTFSYQDVEGSEYVTIELDESETFMSHSGEPMLPVITKTFDFPVGTKINAVNVNINWERLDLDKKVTPTPVMVPKSTEIDIDPNYIAEKRIDENIYSSAKLYPTEPYTIKYGAGLNDNMEHVLKVNVKCFPQYSPTNNYVNIPKDIDIDIEYEPAVTSAPMAEQYDLIIVTHDLFEDSFQRLAAHKISHGITTKLVTVDEIYENYEGAGDFEEVKMYLADHVLEWNTKYVLLGGGHIGQTWDFYVPKFFSHNWDPADEYEPPYDVTYACDLYYADVYYPDQYGHFQMDNWDSNGNGIYGEGPMMTSGNDVPDYYCDVGVGRIPCRYDWEADVVVDKIIDYENNAKDSWFKRACVAGGDGFPPERYPGQASPGMWEGEIMGDYFADLFADAGMTTYKMYCSPTNPDEWLSNKGEKYSKHGDFQVTKSDDVAKEVSKGYGFVCLDGHSNPWSLGSYAPDTGIMPPKITEFYTGFNLIQFNNKGKLAFCVNEGCHNAQWDVCGQWLINQMVSENPRDDFVFSRYEWIPHDASSALLMLEGGGAIGVIGNTALGYGGLDLGITEFVGGWINLRFVEGYAQAGKEYAGDIWVYGIDGYTDKFDVMYDFGDRLTIEERVLIGDPSVKLGGYSSSLSESDETEETEIIYGPVSSPVPTWSVGNKWTYELDNIDIDLDLTTDRSVKLKLSTGDLIFEVTEVTSDSYILSLTSENMDVDLGGINFNFHEEGVEDLVIPGIKLDNITIDGQLIVDKETLGWTELDLGLIIDIIENLDNFKEIIPIELPKFLNFLLPYMSIPANIELKIEFDNPLEIIQFPLETNKYWGFPANTIKLTIDGSVQSPWLKLLSIINKFINIFPAEFAKYLPDIDISQILNDYGIDTIYTIDMPEIPADLMPYHHDTTPFLEVIGSQNIQTKAGQFNADYISIMDGNGQMYYSKDTGYLVKVIGYIGEYLPIIDNLNLELKSYTKA